ncbi:MAG: peptidoglycan DD-metalloendopeptidase family protein [Candidatus Thiodiazotropha sp.]
MSVKDDQAPLSDAFPTVEEALKNVDLQALGQDSEIKDMDELADGYSYALDGEAEYRGWYRRTSGADIGKSAWCPKQSKFGGRNGNHNGADLYSYGREKLLAVASGKIEYNVANDPAGWGNHIYLYFKKGGTWYIACYAHVDASSAFEGQKSVSAGDEIGTAGCSGNAGSNGICSRDYKCGEKVCIEDHLHLELFAASASSPKKDPVAFFGWTVKYASDDTCATCGTSHQQT